MKLTNDQLQNYVKRIKFSKEDKRKYKAQIDTLIDNVRSYIADHTDCKVTKVLQSGSWKKGTILAPKEGIELDIDLVFFIDPGTAAKKDVRKLNLGIVSFLAQVYPNKTASDFWESSKTAGVVFRGSGLSFDIVPVVPVEPEPYVWQPVKGSRGHYYTSIKGQLKFNSDHREANSSYTAIVRMLKKWKNLKELPLSSFSIEIVVGWLDLKYGVEPDIERALIRFFDHMGRSYFLKACKRERDIDKSSKRVVYIADPTNDKNNTAEYINKADWKNIQKEVKKAFDTLWFAYEMRYKHQAIDLWKEVFGTSFSIEPVN